MLWRFHRRGDGGAAELSALAGAIRAIDVMPVTHVVVALAAHHGDLDSSLLSRQLGIPRVHTVKADGIRALIVSAAQHVPSLAGAVKQVWASGRGVSLAVGFTDDWQAVLDR